METISISKAGEKDIPALVTLINKAYRGETSRKGWTTEADFLNGIRIDKEGLQDLIRKENAVVLKAFTPNGNLLGCVYLENQGIELYLGMLTVEPELQGSGIGKLLLKSAEEYAKSLHLKGIKMNVISLRSELIEWYRRHGYEMTTERNPFPTDTRFGEPIRPLEFAVLRKTFDTI